MRRVIDVRKNDRWRCNGEAEVRLERASPVGMQQLVCGTIQHIQHIQQYLTLWFPARTLAQHRANMMVLLSSITVVVC